jgi:hypothetical protein
LDQSSVYGEKKLGDPSVTLDELSFGLCLGTTIFFQTLADTWWYNFCIVKFVVNHMVGSLPPKKIKKTVDFFMADKKSDRSDLGWIQILTKTLVLC